MAIWWSSMDANNWDLQAVVRLGCCSFSTPTTKTTTTTTNSATAVKDPFSPFQSSATTTTTTTTDLHHAHHHHHPHDFVEEINAVPDSIATKNVIHELEEFELCKPFFSLRPPPPPPPPPRGPHRAQLVRPVPPPRKKNRKRPQKVVRQVPADGLPSDMWAWRKYGQKPIKGSPYPRGYYRCSSSKGCSARKQVERSRTDPSMLIITYTGEHNHAVPTHRNSLAGSTRSKFPQNSCSNEEKTEGSSPWSTMSALRSPTTPLVGSAEEENEGDEDEGGTGSIGEMMGDLEEEMGLLDSEGFDDEGSDELVKRFFSEPWEVDRNYGKATGDGGS